MNQIAKKWVKIIATLLVIVTVLFLLQRLLMPKYVSNVVEGAFIAEFYEEENKDYDVVFVGDCEVYENFSPITLWQEYGINSYIRGSAEQYIFQSYYMLEDTLRYTTPDVVIFNVQSIHFNEAQSEAYNRMTLEGMEWSSSKVDAIMASMKEEEQFLDYVFPILRYHSRWNELTVDDFKYMFAKKKVSHNGYYMRVDVKPVETIPAARPLADYSFGDNAWKYMHMMTELCKEKGIDLVLIKAPSIYPYWYEEWDAQIKEYADENDLKYINFLELTEEIGIDYSTDTYDAGLHMNLSGAEKLSRYLGEVLREEFDVEDHRGEEEWESIWKDKIEFYEAEKKAQYEKYGMAVD
jgi:hypothetical protein